MITIIKVSLNLGDSVFRLLFFKGDAFAHILEQIFFNLEPRDLLACSLVCK